MRMLGCGHPYWFDVSSEKLAELASSGQCLRQDMLSTVASDPNALQFLLSFKTALQQRNVKLVICTWDIWSPTPQSCHDIIYNVGGKGDRWVNDWASIISRLQPYAIDVMNEPLASSNDPPAAEFEVYRQFALRCIRAWRAIKPDLVVMVAGYPFGSVEGINNIATNPLPEPNLVYDLHYYYSADNTFPAYYAVEQLAYWQGTDLVDAKNKLVQRLLSSYSVSTFKSKGLNVVFGEVGTHVANPNAQVFLQDFYDFCKQHDVGVIQNSLVPYPRSGFGMLTSDWQELNAIGLVWKRNTLSTPPPTPPPTPPSTPGGSLAARSIGPFGVPSALLHQLWRLRERVIRPEVHKKLHPLV